MYKVILSFQRADKVSEKGFETDSCICLSVFPLPLFPGLPKKMNLKPLPQRTGTIPDSWRGDNRTGTEQLLDAASILSVCRSSALDILN